MAKGKSQAWLGDKLGISFQQVQKYEKGLNKITTGRLQEIGAALEEPLEIFMPSTGNQSEGVALMFAAIQKRDVQRVIKAFGALPPALQRDFTNLVEAVAAQYQGRETT